MELNNSSRSHDKAENSDTSYSKSPQETERSQEKIRKDLISVFSSAIEAIEHHNSSLLRQTSDFCIHNASIYQDRLSLATAVFIYAVSKLIERDFLNKSLHEKMVSMLKELYAFLESGNLRSFEESLKLAMSYISEQDKRIGMYIEHVISQAKIKKGGKIYEHGISLAQTANILGISQWELMRYIGNTHIADKFDDGISIRKRIKLAREIFSGK